MKTSNMLLNYAQLSNMFDKVMRSKLKDSRLDFVITNS